jgi:ABC-type bacteriocin/lantibiotic exporter with double-glycine peptidase domain
VTLAVLPVMVVCSAVVYTIVQGGSKASKGKVAVSLSILQDVVTNIKSVHTLNQRRRFQEIYEESLGDLERKLIYISSGAGTAYGVGNL